MLVLCAWCQQEGKSAVIKGEDDGSGKISHGVCQSHFDALLKDVVKIQQRKSNPRRRKYRRRR